MRLTARTRHIALGGALAAIIAFGVYAWTTPRTYTVVRTETGFEPRQLTIRPGDSVRFVATHGTDFWPASDAHPSHNFNSVLDPKRPLSPTEEWSVMLDRPGLSPYHDHLSPGVRGTIRVLGRVRDLAECTAEFGRSTAQAFCWGQSLIETVRQSGLDAAFADVERMNESPAFQSQCHDVMHILGQAAYDAFIADALEVQAHPMTSACGFGFYHGFIETLMVSEGIQDLSRAKEYCDSLRGAESLTNETARFRAAEACYHGVGHALFDLVDASLWGSPRRMIDRVTEQCRALTPAEKERELCMSGVYNSLANAFSSGSYGLTYPDPDDADRLCAQEPMQYQMRCNIEVTNGSLRDARYTFDRSIAHMRELPEHVRSQVWRAYMDDEIRHQMHDPSVGVAAELCEKFHDETERTDCVAGVLRAFTYMSSAGNEPLASILHSFCNTQTSPVKTRCASMARGQLISTMSTADVQRICTTVLDPESCSGPPEEL